MTKKIIYHNCLSLEGWNLGTFKADLTTWIEEIRLFRIFKWYRIQQNVPRIKDPFFDGEYKTNHLFEIRGKEERAKAKLWLINYKNTEK